MRVGIALGSNLGDRMAHLRAAVAAIREFAEAPVLVSRVYETEPVDCPPGAPSFLNAAIEIGYSGDLFALLERLQAIERKHGRLEIRERNSPRTADLDILYGDDLTIDTAALKVPHPRLSTRAFVLLPLNDIIPDRKLPGAVKTIREELLKLETRGCKLTQYYIDQ